MNIPELIKDKRKTLNESQKEFGKRFNVTHAAVSDWEAGKSEAPYSVIELIFKEKLPIIKYEKCNKCDGTGVIRIPLSS